MRQPYRTDTHISVADLLRLSGRHSCSALVSVNRGRLPTRRLRVTSTRSLKFWNSKNWPMPSSESRVRVYLSNRGEWHGLLECCRTCLTDNATTENVLLLVWSWSPSPSCCSWTSRQVVWVCPRSCRRSSGETRTDCHHCNVQTARVRTRFCDSSRSFRLRDKVCSSRSTSLLPSCSSNSTRFYFSPREDVPSTTENSESTLRL